MTAAIPAEAHCDCCGQLRPLFLFRPTHTHAGGVRPRWCTWCSRPKQPLLCVRCFDKERRLEWSSPAPAARPEPTLDAVLVAAERAAVDLVVCEGIAAATERAEGGA